MLDDPIDYTSLEYDPRLAYDEDERRFVELPGESARDKEYQRVRIDAWNYAVEGLEKTGPHVLKMWLEMCEGRIDELDEKKRQMDSRHRDATFDLRSHEGDDYVRSKLKGRLRNIENTWLLIRHKRIMTLIRKEAIDEVRSRHLTGVETKCLSQEDSEVRSSDLDEMARSKSVEHERHNMRLQTDGYYVCEYAHGLTREMTLEAAYATITGALGTDGRSHFTSFDSFKKGFYSRGFRVQRKSQ